MASLIFPVTGTWRLTDARNVAPGSHTGTLRANGKIAFTSDREGNREPNNYLAMVCAFMTSGEYQLRFGTVATRSNADCGR